MKKHCIINLTIYIKGTVMREELKKISNRYKLNNFTEQITTIDNNIELKIGFLGEFSSGKSTLINAILEQKVLPSMDKPTSKTVVAIEAKDKLSEIEYYRVGEKKLKSISAVEFSDIALSSGDDRAMLRVPSNEFFQDGYTIIDTPGISSLDESDTDITYGYLPFLDCAVICNHIQKGSLTQSIIEFIKKDEIRPIINNLLFVITNSHLKSPKSQYKIKQEIISQLKELNKNSDLGIENIESKVVMVSALEAMEGKDNYSLDALKDSFLDIFIKRKSTLVQERVDKELVTIAGQMLDALIFKRDNLNLNIDELKEKEYRLEKSIDEFIDRRKKILEELTILNSKIFELVSSIFSKYIPIMVGIKRAEEVEPLIIKMGSEVSSEINRVISEHFEMGNISDKSECFLEVGSMLDELLQQIDVGKDIGVVVLIEILTLGTAGIAGLLGFFLRSSSEMLVNTEGRSNLKYVAQYIQKVNPMETLGDRIGAVIIEKKLTSKLDELSERISNDIIYEVEEILRRVVFSMIEEKLESEQNMLNQIYEEKSNRTEEYISLSQELSDDILELQLIQRG
jgi:GTPase SAR1 family protein